MSTVVNKQHIQKILSLGNSYKLSLPAMKVLRKAVLSDGVQTVCETGSGCSTVLLASCGVDFISLEHDTSYARKTRSWLKDFGFSYCVHRVIEAQVEKYEDNFRYVGLDQNKSFDLLLIDGPSRKTYGRKGVLYSLWDMLNKGCFILIDDSDERHVKECITSWKTSFGDDFQFVKKHRKCPTGLAVYKKA